MARRKFFKKSVKKSNWSHENKGCLFEVAENAVNGLYQSGALVVPSVTTQGTRTVGNFTITVPSSIGANSGVGEVYWALVYVPQGTTASALFATTGSVEGSLYEPNQYVLASGISDQAAGPIRIRTRMSRKLHSGDFISLIIGTPGQLSTSQAQRALVSYSVKYN